MYPTSLDLQLGPLKVHGAFQRPLSVGPMVAWHSPLALVHSVLGSQHQDKIAPRMVLTTAGGSE